MFGERACSRCLFHKTRKDRNDEYVPECHSLYKASHIQSISDPDDETCMYFTNMDGLSINKFIDRCEKCKNIQLCKIYDSIKSREDVLDNVLTIANCKLFKCGSMK